MAEQKLIHIDLVPSFNFLHPLQLISEAVMKEAGAGKMDEDSQTYNFVLAVDEIVTNILKHGFDLTKKPFPITIKFIINNKKVTAEIYDEGEKYEPPSNYNQDIVMEQFCGMGLHFVKTLMDEYQYLYDNKQKKNIVIISIHLKKILPAVKPRQ
ncbi:MAG: ATP-binding protein [Spirochaetes bacterium]|nr:ATP-binding protein [Spirochaetota bacterium]